MSSHWIEADPDRHLRPVRPPSSVAADALADLPPVIDLMHAAALLGLGRTTAYKLVRTGQWPTPLIRIGRLIRVPTAPLRDLLSCSTSSSSTLPPANGN